MKFKFSPLKPRNPVVPAMQFRHGGAHRAAHATQRQHQHRALQRELAALDSPPPRSP